MDAAGKPWPRGDLCTPRAIDLTASGRSRKEFPVSVCLELAKIRPVNDKILMNLMWGGSSQSCLHQVPRALPALLHPSGFLNHFFLNSSLAVFFLSAVVWGYCCWGRAWLELHEPLIKYPASILEGAGKSKSPFSSVAEQLDVCRSCRVKPKLGVLWGCRC